MTFLAIAKRIDGFFERLLELSGGKNINAELCQKSWASDPTTIIEIAWE